VPVDIPGGRAHHGRVDIDLRDGFESGVIVEIAGAALQAVLMPFGVKPRPVVAAGPGRTRPVVLIHGYGSNRSCLLPLEACLRAVGFDRVYPFNFASGSAVEQSASALAGFVDEVRTGCRVESGTVDLVAYSLGGLVARVYLQELDGHRRVDQCITLATPHHGTYSSYWAPTAIGRQLRPESDFLQKLAAPGRRAAGVRYLSLWAEQDLVVLPREHAVYEQGDDACIRGVGHMGILVHPATLRLVAERLRAGQDIPATRLARVAWLSRSVLAKATALIGRIRTVRAAGRG